jgi:hypothetical protein
LASYPFPSLPPGFEATRSALHAYAKALGTLPQTHIAKHPKWWHISLKVRPAGLMIDNIGLPDGGLLNGWLDLRTHEVVIETSRGERQSFDMTAGASGSEMADAIIRYVAGHGLGGDYVRKDFENEDPTTYDRDHAHVYWSALTNASRVLEAHRASIDGTVGPLQFWPHGFDLAFEWFGTKEVSYEGALLPSQLNLGFYSTGDPYFYSVPWPLDRSLLEGPSPGEGRWCDDPFSGAILDYAVVADRLDGAEVLMQFAADVYAAARPTLLE